MPEEQENTECFVSLEHDVSIQEYYEKRAAELFSPASASWVDLHYLRQQNTPVADKAFVQAHDNPFESSSNSLVSDLPRYQVCDDDYSNVVCRERLEKQNRLTELIHDVNAPLKAFFVRQRHTFSRLSISQVLFEHVIATCNSSSNFKEFALCFGRKSRENDVCPPPFRFRAINFETTRYGSFECAYGLRYVELNHRGGDKEPWSVRQMAIQQRYDKLSMSSTWILIAASRTVEKRVDRYIGRTDHRAATHPFELHVAIIDAALISWRWYIASLVDRTTDQSNRVVLAQAGDGKLSALAGIQINFEDRQRLIILEERTLDALAILDSTIDTISTFLKQYKWFSSRCNVDITDGNIVHNLEAQRAEAVLNRMKADTVYKKVKGTASLLSDLLDYENALIGHKNEVSLKELAQQAQSENAVMRVLAEKNTRDAAAVKVLTVITLIYLPATVVANFFSSQFVNIQELKNGRLKIEVADNAWLFAAASIPLTVVTLLVWYSWSRLQHRLTGRKCGEKRRSSDSYV